MREFGETYFRHYGGRNRPYRKAFAEYCTSPADVRAFLRAAGRPLPRTILDLGAADGSALRLYGKVFAATVLHGVELSRYAFERRLVDGIFHGDMHDFIARRPESFQATYDLVLVNSAMYLRPDRLTPFLRSLRALCHKSTAIILTLPTCYPAAMQDYAAELRFPARRIVPIIRPKAWWIEAAYDAGFEIECDLDASGLLLVLPGPRFSRPLIFGDPENVTVSYEYERPHASAKTAELRLRHRESGLALQFAYDAAASAEGFQELGEPRSKAQGRALCRALPDILAFFRSGRIGHDRRIRFRSLSAPLYVPGTLCRPLRRGLFTLQSDESF